MTETSVDPLDPMALPEREDAPDVEPCPSPASHDDADRDPAGGDGEPA